MCGEHEVNRQGWEGGHKSLDMNSLCIIPIILTRKNGNMIAAVHGSPSNFWVST